MTVQQDERLAIIGAPLMGRQRKTPEPRPQPVSDQVARLIRSIGSGKYNRHGLPRMLAVSQATSQQKVGLTEHEKACPKRRIKKRAKKQCGKKGQGQVKTPFKRSGLHGAFGFPNLLAAAERREHYRSVEFMSAWHGLATQGADPAMRTSKFSEEKIIAILEPQISSDARKRK